MLSAGKDLPNMEWQSTSPSKLGDVAQAVMPEINAICLQTKSLTQQALVRPASPSSYQKHGLPFSRVAAPLESRSTTCSHLKVLLTPHGFEDEGEEDNKEVEEMRKPQLSALPPRPGTALGVEGCWRSSTGYRCSTDSKLMPRGRTSRGGACTPTFRPAQQSLGAILRG